MNDEKKYNEALERARKLYEQGTITESLCYVFPELKESEDEKVRKEIMSYIKSSGAITNKQWIAWLEKQGEQNPTDKVESKFKIGDWIIRNNEHTGVPVQVIEFKGYYRCDLNGEVVTLTPNDVHNNFHLWTIQDAKDGDVLSYRDGQWIFIYKEKIDDSSFYYHTLYSTIHQGLTINDSAFTLLGDAIIPATKEQRDTLLKAMADAGYTFDFEKKELNKVKQKHAWSEEDIKMFVNIKACLRNANKDYSREVDWLKSIKPRPKNEWSEEDEIKIKSIIAFLKSPSLCAMDGNKGIIDENIKYLKSLKERVQPQQWKPSDEQLKSLQEVIDAGHYTSYPYALETLFEQLKQL